MPHPSRRFRRPGTLALAAALLAGLSCGGSLAAQSSPVLELIGHAAVVVESSTGTRILIDPYESDHWTGLRFPDGLALDAVLVTHPHFDHDGVAQLSPDIPVLHAPQARAFGDVSVRGVAAEHIGPDRYRSAGSEPWNTWWVVEVDGVRIVHLGDSAPAEAQWVAALGPVDVVLFPPWFSPGDVRAMFADADPSVIIPVHFASATHRDEGLGLPTADQWLATHPDEIPDRVDPRWRMELSAGADGTARLVVPMESLERTGWSVDLREAWRHARAAGESAGDSAGDGTGESNRAARIEHLRAAVRSAPDVLVFGSRLAATLSEAGDPAGALAEILRALAADPAPDRETEVHARLLAARLLLEADRRPEAVALLEPIVDREVTYAAPAIAEARRLLGG